MASQPKEGILIQIPPKQILPNKENPRILFDEEDLTFLRKSISEVGILVPLTVYRRKSDRKYVLLDGERRWRCAIELGLQEIPCNQVEEPSLITNILWMFNIHNTRKEWELVPTALKLQTIIRLLGDKSNTELAKLTGMSTIRVSDCKKILTFPKRFLDLAIVVSEEERITGDFFSQMYRFLEEVAKFPKLSREFPRDRITELMIKKYRAGIFTAILEFRVLKNALVDARKRGVPESQIAKKTREYFESEVMSPVSYYDAVTGTTYGIGSILKNAARLRSSLNELELRTAQRDEELLQTLRELREAIERILQE